jgi:uncharacterized protein (DUF305 family)
MKNHMNGKHSNKHYVHLLIMAVLSFISMYILMYAMVDRLENVYPNFNQFYMAGLMAAPMVVIELIVMRSMYENKKLNIIIAGVSVIVAITFFMFIRQQAGVSDQQFLKSMIPHHAAAVLICEQAPLQNTGISELCKGIVSNQQAEIDQMKALLTKLED